MIIDNWSRFSKLITDYIQEPRCVKLLDFYKQFKDRILTMPASSKKAYHSCYEGGYIAHVINMVSIALELDEVWKNFGVASTYSTEELVFAAVNHDLGKIGDAEHPYYLKNTSEWHIKNQGQIYTHNPELPLMPVPDRSIFLLQQAGIEISYNEFVSIKTHDGLYSDANKEYLMGYSKLNTSLPYIIHQADITAARIEYEQDNLGLKTEPIIIPKRRTKKDIITAVFNEKTGSITNILNSF